ncbi:MAG: glycosyltransferase family 4 protein [Lachnospiraceae bacterium]|nr:glycosyltransferase family 4 protein [Lachnospiraceae bacterium]
MKLLWVCNMILPQFAQQFGVQGSNKEGWLSGLANKIIDGERKEIEFHIAFPHDTDATKIIKSEDDKLAIVAHGFRENSSMPHIYSETAYEDLKLIFQEIMPDVVHVFGTEYPHTLMCAKIAGELGIEKRLLIGIQGVMKEYAPVYMAGLPQKVIKKRTFRDWLKKDSLTEQQEKYYQRAEYEVQAIKLAKNITGRTFFDKNAMLEINSGLNYYEMNETLRKDFYSGSWDVNQCTLHSIFVSQGNYPIKGIHIALEALPIIREEYPDVTLRVAGDNIIKYSGIKNKIKISNYGKYLRKLISKNKLWNAVQFIGNKNACEMKEEYLKTHVSLCCSVIENSPNSLGEAMILGTPVVTADVGGISDMAVREEECLFYNWSEPAELASQIIRTFRETEETLKRTIKAREHAIITHSGEKNCERLFEIYDALMAENA